MNATQRIIELLHRNLQEVFGEGDSARRHAAIEEFYTDDCALYVPDGVLVGHDALDKFAGELRATHPRESRRLYTTREYWHGARAQKVSHLSTPGSTLSLFASARSLHCTSSSIRSCHPPSTTFAPPGTA